MEWVQHFACLCTWTLSKWSKSGSLKANLMWAHATTSRAPEKSQQWQQRQKIRRQPQKAHRNAMYSLNKYFSKTHTHDYIFTSGAYGNEKTFNWINICANGVRAPFANYGKSPNQRDTQFHARRRDKYGKRSKKYLWINIWHGKLLLSMANHEHTEMRRRQHDKQLAIRWEQTIYM